MKMIHMAEMATATPRRAKVGLLIFNHAFFIGDKDSMGTEITVFSRRWLGCAKGVRRVWFRIDRHNATSEPQGSGKDDV